MAKKNYKKYWAKMGGTVAIAMAMTVAMSPEALAAEEELAPQPGNENQENLQNQDNQNAQELNGAELAEANQAVDQANQQTAQENQQTAENNQQAAADNDAAVKENEQATDGQLENPDLAPPEAPEVPNTDGLDAEDHNEVVDDYNQDVDDYNQDVDDYNKDVDDYNDAADAYEQEAQDQYEKDQAEYDQAKEEHENAQAEYEAEKEKHDQESAEYDQYLKDQEQYEKEQEQYEKDKADYEEKLPQHQAETDAYNQYQENLEQAEKNYTEGMDGYEKDLSENGGDVLDAYNDNLGGKTVPEENFEEVNDIFKDAEQQYKDEEELHKEIEGNNAAYDQAKADYEKALEQYEAAISDPNKSKVDAYNEILSGKTVPEDYKQKAEEILAATQKALADEQKANADQAADNQEYQNAQDNYNEAKEGYDAAMEANPDDALGAYKDHLQDLGQVDDTNAQHAQDAYKAAQDQANAEHKQATDDFKAYDAANTAYNDAMAAYNEALNTMSKYDAYMATLGKLENVPEDKKDELDKILTEAEAEKNAELKSEYDEEKANSDAYKAAQDAYTKAIADYNTDIANGMNALDAYNKHFDGKDMPEDKADEIAALREAAETYRAGQEAAHKGEEAAYQKVVSNYNKALADYNAAVANGMSKLDAYNQYLDGVTVPEEQMDAANALLAEVEKEYDAAQKEYTPKADAYEDYQKQVAAAAQTLEAALANYNANKGTTLASQIAAYNTYLATVELPEEQYNAILEVRKELADQYEAAKAAHTEAVRQYNIETEVYDNVTKYNNDVNADNADIKNQNAALNKDIHTGVVESLADVGEINKKVTGVTDDELAVLGKDNYNALITARNNLAIEAAALENHIGKDADLGSAEYAAYLEAVQTYNENVKTFNGNALAYNTAVENYNKAVQAYNEEYKPTLTEEGQYVEGQGDWGNIKTSNWYAGHLDVSKTGVNTKKLQTDANGNVVYDENNQPVFENDLSASYTLEGIYTTEDASGKYGLQYKNSASDKKWSTQGLDIRGSWDTQEFGGSGVRFNPETGLIQFYATVQNSDGEEEVLPVSLNAASVYADGTLLNVSKVYDSDKAMANFAAFRYGENKDTKLTMIVDEDTVDVYYDISGQSVFVVSSLVCGNAKPTNNKTQINPAGMDLVVNTETLIRASQNLSAKKLSFVGYELGKTAQAQKRVDNPGQFQELTIDTPDMLDVVTDPGPAPDSLEVLVEKENPGQFQAPAVGTYTLVDVAEDPGKFEEIKLDGKNTVKKVSDPGETPEQVAPLQVLNFVEHPGEYNKTVPTGFDLIEKDDRTDVFSESRKPVAPDALKPVQKPDDLSGPPTPPTAPDVVADPGEGPKAPGKFDREAPKAPEKVIRLTRLDHIEKMDRKYIILFDENETIPDGDDFVDVPTPFALDFAEDAAIVVRPANGLTTILDEEVPLADAPETGDPTLLFGAAGLLSLFGSSFLRKKKEEA